jgi:hypothetical protein
MISIATLESEEMSIAHYTLYLGLKANLSALVLTDTGDKALYLLPLVSYHSICREPEASWRLSAFVDTSFELSYNTVRRFDHYGMEHGTAKETV